MSKKNKSETVSVNPKISKPTGFDDSKLGPGISGNVKKMIGEYERQSDMQRSGSFDEE